MTGSAWTLPSVLDEGRIGEAAEVLRRYFRLGVDGEPNFTGAMFERLGGGGDRPDVADVFTATDILAVTMLSVKVPAAATLRILESGHDHLNAVLAQLPTGVDLVDASDDQLEVGGRLWDLLRHSGVGRVTTSKLLARKRPRLLPVIDTVVKEALNHPRREDYYRTLRLHLANDGHALHRHLEEVRELAEIGSDISIIRVFDVIVWMQGRYPETESQAW